eukprot:scaffold3394_cov385-Prasinococcus_capsulatus_cf.AAC.1
MPGSFRALGRVPFFLSSRLFFLWCSRTFFRILYLVRSVVRFERPLVLVFTMVPRGAHGGCGGGDDGDGGGGGGGGCVWNSRGPGRALTYNPRASTRHARRHAARPPARNAARAARPSCVRPPLALPDADNQPGEDDVVRCRRRGRRLLLLETPYSLLNTIPYQTRPLSNHAPRLRVARAVVVLPRAIHCGVELTRSIVSLVLLL